MQAHKFLMVITTLLLPAFMTAGKHTHNPYKYQQNFNADKNGRVQGKQTKYEQILQTQNNSPKNIETIQKHYRTKNHRP